MEFGYGYGLDCRLKEEFGEVGSGGYVLGSDGG